MQPPDPQRPAQTHPRVRKRIPCEVSAGGERHTGIVLNVSRGGLFVQTDVAIPVGGSVAIDLTAGAPDTAIPLEAAVVWRKAVPLSLRGVNQSGIGLRVSRAPEAYGQLVDGLLEADREQGARASRERRPGPRYRVRLRMRGTPRSKSVVVRCTTEDEARRLALGQHGDGWTVLDSSRIDAAGPGA